MVFRTNINRFPDFLKHDIVKMLSFAEADCAAVVESNIVVDVILLPSAAKRLTGQY